jgi:uncharacterized protein (TIGR00159 family)
MSSFDLFYFGIRWQDIVDILLNSYFLFRFYVLFRGTIVLRGLIGIVLLWFIQRLAVFTGLILTSWATQGLMAVAALIIIVIFRNEIRGIIQTKDLKSMLWGIPQRSQTLTPVENLVEAVFEMSQKYIGGLIVLPGEKDIRQLIQNGITWQGKLSKEMIISIFWHDNPVHDGAAVIQGDRVTDVGVILPLSHRNDIPSYYGTRHRSALGLAENSDAMVIVVSEESGRIIVAKNNNITPVHRKSLLVDIIQKHLNIKSQKNDEYSIREKLKIAIAALISLLLVAGVWGSFSKGIYTLVTLDVPIEYMNRESAMVLFDTSVNSVKVHLSGSGALIKSIRPDQVSVRIDLSQAKPGKNTFPITENNISTSPGVILRKVEPDEVDVCLGSPITKKVPVQVNWTGSLDPNLLMTEVTLTPDIVQIIGPSWVVNELTTIYTEKINLNTIKNSGSLTAPLNLDSNKHIKLASGNKDSVTVNYIIHKKEEPDTLQ